jgi:pyoverdine/dityrosine biosynthesis protein Dit1
MALEQTCYRSTFMGTTGESANSFRNDIGLLREKDEMPVENKENFDFNGWVEKHKGVYDCIGSNACGATLEERVLNVLTNQRIRSGSARTLDIDGYRDAYLAKIRGYIQRDEPVQLMIPAFPFKFPNPLKTQNVCADMAELAALTQLQGICDAISLVYDGGAEFTIAHDGKFYCDLFHLPPTVPEGYKSSLKHLAKKIGADNIHFVDIMEDLIEPRRNEWDEALASNLWRIEKKWDQLSGEPYVVNLAKNSRCNMNFKPHVGDEFPVHGESQSYQFDDFFGLVFGNGEYAGDSRRNDIEDALERFTQRYFALNSALKELGVLEDRFKSHLRTTVHPKPGQLGVNLVNKKTQRVPWSGVCTVKCNGSSKNGYTRIKFWYDVARQPDKYVALKLPEWNHPFGYREVVS